MVLITVYVFASTKEWDRHRWCNGERARLEYGRSWVRAKDYAIGICCFSTKHVALR
jgi:hypothetical protein